MVGKGHTQISSHDDGEGGLILIVMNNMAAGLQEEEALCAVPPRDWLVQWIYLRRIINHFITNHMSLHCSSEYKLCFCIAAAHASASVLSAGTGKRQETHKHTSRLISTSSGPTSCYQMHVLDS